MSTTDVASCAGATCSKETRNARIAGSFVCRSASTTSQRTFSGVSGFRTAVSMTGSAAARIDQDERSGRRPVGAALTASRRLRFRQFRNGRVQSSLGRQIDSLPHQPRVAFAEQRVIDRVRPGLEFVGNWRAPFAAGAGPKRGSSASSSSPLPRYASASRSTSGIRETSTVLAMYAKESATRGVTLGLADKKASASPAAAGVWMPMQTSISRALRRSRPMRCRGFVPLTPRRASQGVAKSDPRDVDQHRVGRIRGPPQLEQRVDVPQVRMQSEHLGRSPPDKRILIVPAARAQPEIAPVQLAPIGISLMALTA